jgi:condensin complex subunit 3
LVIGKYLDFSDATSRKVAESFLQKIMHLPAGYLDNDVVIGDGVSLAGDKQWATAVGELSWKVHGTVHGFVKMASDVVAELGRPCREGGARVMQWINCLAATGFLLENMESLHQLNGHPIEAQELLGGILLPAVSHICKF